ncbi:MAG: outer membrane beta-barrel protein [Chitinophagaceae bacterium]
MRRYNIDELEELLKDKSDQYLMYPSDRVWKNIQKNIQPNQTFTIVSAFVVFLLAAGFSVLLNEQKISKYTPPSGQLAYQLTENNWKTDLPLVEITGRISNRNISNRNEIQSFRSAIPSIQSEESIFTEHPLQLPVLPKIELTKNLLVERNIRIKNKRPGFIESISNVIEKAKQIGKQAKWQIYFGPNIGYRALNGYSSTTNYLYNSYAYSTNSLFARNVKDAVIHKPAVGFMVGAALRYPISKNITIQAGLQANYHRYQIEASRGLPEIATYGMNNLGFGAYPINAVSNYVNGNNYTAGVSLSNERFMISMPIGFDYKVIGSKKLNFSIASTIQPTYILNSSAYLISTNLRNYAKAPNLNRRWNINTGLEANINFEKGNYKWTVGPQLRYQLLHSFTEKYPIKENLYDIGLRVGIMKTF